MRSVGGSPKGAAGHIRYAARKRLPVAATDLRADTYTHGKTARIDVSPDPFSCTLPWYHFGPTGSRATALLPIGWKSSLHGMPCIQSTFTLTLANGPERPVFLAGEYPFSAEAPF